jgi:hypothetical protein
LSVKRERERERERAREKRKKKVRTFEAERERESEGSKVKIYCQFISYFIFHFILIMIVTNDVPSVSTHFTSLHFTQNPINLDRRIRERERENRIESN